MLILMRSFPRITTGVIATLAVVSGVACSKSSRGSSSAPVARSPVELTVDNKSSADLTIYVVHDGRSERLDRIEGARKKVLAIPVRMLGALGDLRLIGERQGARVGFSGRIATQSVTPLACQRLEWSIEARLEQSTLGVFPTNRCG